jgi:predicted nucleic acid-binding protein
MISHARIEIVQPTPLLRLLKEEVDAGEAAALALGVSLHADLVLIDEMRGRVIARRLGLPVAGTLGVVVRAKRGGMIPAARPIIDQVRTLGGLWVTDELVAQVLTGLGE